MSNLFLIIVALLLVALNGFFVAAEFGLVKLPTKRVSARLPKHGVGVDAFWAKVHAKLDAYLSACQLGITLASLGLGWVGEPAFASLLAPVFGRLGITSPELIHGISIACAFTIISFLHIVVGELAPKSLAIRNPEQIGLLSAAPLYGFYWLMYPAIWLLNSSAIWCCASLAFVICMVTMRIIQPMNLNLFCAATARTIGLPAMNGIFWQKTLDFSELEVSDLMRPIQEMTALHRNKSVQENLKTVYGKRFSRYPYFDTNGVDVLGVIHLKDLFFAQQEGKSIGDLHKYLRPIQYISPDMPALELFPLFSAWGRLIFARHWTKGQKPQGFITWIIY